MPILTAAETGAAISTDKATTLLQRSLDFIDVLSWSNSVGFSDLFFNVDDAF